jgi:hypothetical protein
MDRFGIPDNLMSLFMSKVNTLFRKYRVLGYNACPTDSENVTRLSVFIASNDYKHGDYAWARELGNYLEGRFPELADSHSSIVNPCPQCSQRPVHGF